MKDIMVIAALREISETIERALGLGLSADALEFHHMAWRALVVFWFSIFLMRVGAKRLLGKNAALDVMLAVILGSVLSRAINGQAAFYPTLGVSLVLVLLHRLVAKLSLHSHLLALFAKGSDRVLIRDGKVDHAELKRALMSFDDLLENLRLNGNVDDLKEVKEARLERNGTISVVKRSGGSA